MFSSRKEKREPSLFCPFSELRLRLLPTTPTRKNRSGISYITSSGNSLSSTGSGEYKHLTVSRINSRNYAFGSESTLRISTLQTPL